MKFYGNSTKSDSGVRKGMKKFNFYNCSGVYLNNQGKYKSWNLSTNSTSDGIEYFPMDLRFPV